MPDPCLAWISLSGGVERKRWIRRWRSAGMGEVVTFYNHSAALALLALTPIRSRNAATTWLGRHSAFSLALHPPPNFPIPTTPSLLFTFLVLKVHVCAPPVVEGAPLVSSPMPSSLHPARFLSLCFRRHRFLPARKTTSSNQVPIGLLVEWCLARVHWLLCAWSSSSFKPALDIPIRPVHPTSFTRANF
ncbi:hypothetical protein B0H13DRAFT_2349183 [Mycena leptocephala]|nr:hypothetical protein B0H13DRAFT_2349183 [Mycena leptocephala]